MTSIQSQLEERMTAAFADRNDHRARIGIKTKPSRLGVRFYWRDEQYDQEGFLCECSNHQLTEITMRALELISELRNHTGLKAKPKRKKRPNLDRKALRMMQNDTPAEKSLPRFGSTLGRAA